MNVNIRHFEIVQNREKLQMMARMQVVSKCVMNIIIRTVKGEGGVLGARALGARDVRALPILKKNLKVQKIQLILLKFECINY